ncbi:MAG TPA: hypothetical protein VI997_04800, partial [Candidatus Thermoplasmatota archaeon]|nr:hypothetical protein [Candidatus Thermoplasmatota archaeon]
MRHSAPYIGLAVAGIGTLAYAAVQLRTSGVGALFDILQGGGLLLAAVGWVFAAAGRGRGLLVGGLSMGVFSAVRSLPQLFQGDTTRTMLAGTSGALG